MSEHRPRIGIDRPDSRGRIGLDQVGRDLARNPAVIVRTVEVTSDGWHVLRRTTFEYRRSTGRWETQQRETYDRGNGAVVLPYDAERGCVLLIRQFRYPAYVNDHPDGMLVEAAAGLLDGDDPLTAVRRESAEELGVVLGELTHVLDAYMSPGSVTERLVFFMAEYSAADRIAEGGGLIAEGEDIEVLELPLEEALAMVGRGEIMDAKTIMLLQYAKLAGLGAE